MPTFTNIQPISISQVEQILVEVLYAIDREKFNGFVFSNAPVFLYNFYQLISTGMFTEFVFEHALRIPILNQHNAFVLSFRLSVPFTMMMLKHIIILTNLSTQLISKYQLNLSYSPPASQYSAVQLLYLHRVTLHLRYLLLCIDQFFC